ncbi:MAG: HlyD family efflux transporter periplasmic adaptor subunit [Candidatus Brocadiales bacterium]|nr:HlyD family efflux transporter periplasmic adaptor subunit [Candidatus Brocadiales bacterium]
MKINLLFHQFFINRVHRTTSLFPLFIILCLLISCGKQEAVDTGPNPRPVKVLELREFNPVKPLQLTGSVMSWKEQDISFEVSGRLEWIVEMGTNLAGRWEEKGEVHVKGDLLAQIEERPFKLKLKTARAERDRAEAEYIRNSKAWENNAIAEVDYIRATAERDSRQARFEQAEYDLECCSLYAPFDGEVSEVYVEAGGYGRTGEAVAHLVMMDPIKIDISVSSETAERLKLRDAVSLFLPGEEKPAFGTVYEKSTVADPETRTFRVSIITRNKQSIGNLQPDDPLLEHPRIRRYIFLQRMKDQDEESPYFVEENRSLRKDSEGYYVWAAPDIKLGDSLDPEKPLITLKKYRVTPGEQRMNLQGLYLIREITDIGNLVPGTLIAMDVPDDFKDGSQVLVAENQWHLRPGQLIPVYLGSEVPLPGLYLPMNSIKPIDDKTAEIFVARNGKAKKVKVRILENVGELFSIEALDPGEDSLVAPGAWLLPTTSTSSITMSLSVLSRLRS